MIKFAVAAFAALTISGAAFAETPINFTWEGHQIVGTVRQVGEVQILKGLDRTTGRAFELQVRNGYVRGTVDDQPVSYRIPREKPVSTASVG